MIGPYQNQNTSKAKALKKDGIQLINNTSKDVDLQMDR